MKILVFSDTHFDTHFEEKRFEFLVNMIKRADKVIINGDLWEGFKISFDDFISSEWSALFPYLKEKNAVYIYGNHDREHLSDKQVELFSDEQTHAYEIGMDDYTLVIEHGDRFFKKFKKLTNSATLFKYVDNYYADRFLHASNIFLNKYFQKNIYMLFHKFHNNTIKKSINLETDENKVYVCGHTHAADFDLMNRYINTGVIRYGMAQYLWIEDGGIMLEKSYY